MLRKSLLAPALLMLSSAASASVIVLGNYKTGEVIIEGNSPGGAEAARAVALAAGGQDAGWIQIYGPDDDQRGWGTVLCVRHKEGYFFAEAIGETSEEEANRTVNLKADRFLARRVGGDDAGMIEKAATWPEMARLAAESGIGEKIKCVPAWNNQGQPISYSGKSQSATVAAQQNSEPPAVGKTEPQPGSGAADMATGGQQASKATSPPKRDYEAEYQAKLRVWQEQQAEHRRQVSEHEEAQRQVEALKASQRKQAEGVLSDYQRKLAEHAEIEAAFAEEKRRWEVATQQQAAGTSDSAGARTSIADAFKVQNDAEWQKVSQGLPEPGNFPGHPFAYCYQRSSVDSFLYQTEIFATKKQTTELEMEFADEVARRTRIGAAMSTHCHISVDRMYLLRLKENVIKVHADRTPETLANPR